ncbi:LysE family transporter [Nonomuraea sp. B12E4]|uniref:LysE family transporter n=1 Tax=Nonomuraea sp. B12E4 TaxID=3153564 RepID=UPI00325CFD23
MTSLTQIAAFGGVVMLGAMSPGPDFAVVVRRSAVSGRRHGMAAAAGISVGVFVWVGFLVVANVVGALRRLFDRPAVRRTIDGLTGAALIALGLKLATAARA